MFLDERKPVFLFFLLSVSLLSGAQVCPGSLGDPVVNVTFGPGNTGNPPPVAVSNYTYTSSSCPNDGSYTITNSTSNCFGSTWHNVLEDHTPGDVNGNMMVVNASFNPGDFYLDTIKGLCPNITYEFAAWVLNILQPFACNSSGIRPNLTFEISTKIGGVLKTSNSGDISDVSVPAWKQYGLFFTTPANVNSIILRITNNAPGGCGNDLILDDITFRPCGPKVTAAIRLNGNPTHVDICKEDTKIMVLNASLSAGYNNPAFQWQSSVDGVTWADIPGAITTSYTRNPTAPGDYQYRLSVAEQGNISVPGCRIASNVITIQVHEKPEVHMAANNPVCEGSPLTLSAGGGATYHWTGPNGFVSSEANPSVTASLHHSGKYYVSVKTEAGCVNGDSLSVQVYPAPIADAGTDETICEGKRKKSKKR